MVFVNLCNKHFYKHVGSTNSSVSSVDEQGSHHKCSSGSRPRQPTEVSPWSITTYNTIWSNSRSTAILYGKSTATWYNLKHNIETERACLSEVQWDSAITAPGTSYETGTLNGICEQGYPDESVHLYVVSTLWIDTSWCKHEILWSDCAQSDLSSPWLRKFNAPFSWER